jgi:hypothetical protein
MAEILLKVVLNTITLIHTNRYRYIHRVVKTSKNIDI